MSIDFFVSECRTDNIKAGEFGICDSVDTSSKTPAYIDYDNEKSWIAHVKNMSEHSMTFTAIDNCIVIHRDNGEMDYRCDAMLTNVDNIVFVELKCQRKDWIQHAVWEQLYVTIKHFCENNDIGRYRYRRAFVCNRKHPRFDHSNKELRQNFYRKTGVRLNIQCEIIIR